MLCCTLGPLIAAIMGKRLMPGARSSLAVRPRLLIAMSAVSLLTSGFSAYHLGHYLDRARADERTLLAEIMAQPVCTQSGIIPTSLFNQRRKL